MSLKQNSGSALQRQPSHRACPLWRTPPLLLFVSQISNFQFEISRPPLHSRTGVPHVRPVFPGERGSAFDPLRSPCRSLPARCALPRASAVAPATNFLCEPRPCRSVTFTVPFAEPAIAAEGAWRRRVVNAFSPLRLCESRRSPRLSVILRSISPSLPCRQLQQTLPLQLQLHALLRSVDYRRLMCHLTPFRINTSKLSEVLITEDLCRT
jgi:hypothetical protein